MLAPSRTRHIAAALGACAALGVSAGGCGSSSKSSSTASPPPAPAATTPAATTPAATTPASGAQSGTPAANPALAHKPKVAKGRGPAPSTLRVKDIVKGSGPAVQAGQTLTVQYVGVLYRNGKQFDASWDHGQPFSFPLGTGQVIPGWDQGLAGMHVGGRRQLIIPAALGYGAQGSPPAIGPNEPLIFVIDLLSAQ